MAGVQTPFDLRARADASRLVSLAHEIQSQLQAGPEQIPASLAGELKEVRKFAERIRKDLLL